MRRTTFALLCCLLSGLAILAVAAPARAVTGKSETKMSDAALMKALGKAAPKSVLDHATIMAMDPDGSMRTVRQGDNGFTCMDPDNSPMCADKAAMEWVDAWQGHKPPPSNGLGFVYMLSGDTGTSNTDPYAKAKTADNNWIQTGAHVMVVGDAAKEMAKNYPRDAMPDPKKPYVMWAGTPYEHLMLPVN
jgi:hypothetical protein